MYKSIISYSGSGSDSPALSKTNTYGIIEGGDIDPWDIENDIVLLNLELCLIIN